VKREVEAGGEIANEFEVRVGFSSAESVVQMGDVEDEAELGGASVEHAQECHGVCPAGDTDREAQAGPEMFRIKQKSELAGHFQNDRRDGLDPAARSAGSTRHRLTAPRAASVSTAYR
jgi:hypothetical protein